MVYECGKCGYCTDRRQNYDRHKNRKRHCVITDNGNKNNKNSKNGVKNESLENLENVHANLENVHVGNNRSVKNEFECKKL